MPVLRNSRHEAFAQKLATGTMSQEQAYLAVGYKQSASARKHASRLATRDDIRGRVAELQMRAVYKMDEMAAVSAESLMREVEEARLRAMELGQTSAAVAAAVAKAKLAGVWIERSEQTHKTGDLDQLSDDQLAAIIRQGEPTVPPNPEAKKLN